METKIINILSFFIHGICKSDMGYLDTIYVVHIQLCCKKGYSDLKKVNF